MTKDYAQALRANVSSMRIGVPRELFFADIDPDIEAAMLPSKGTGWTAGASIALLEFIDAGKLGDPRRDKPCPTAYPGNSSALALSDLYN